MESALRCPTCLTPLALTQKQWTCPSNHRWDTIDDIPRFTQSIARYNKDHLEEKSYLTFFNNVDTKGFKSAMDSLLHNPNIKKQFKIPFFLSDSKRNDFLYLLDLNPQSKVLDYGSGWGNTSIRLAEMGHSVCALEADEWRARFANRYFREKKASNILPIIAGTQAGTNDHLPFEDETFDAIILNGVLEWTAVSIPGDPVNIHQKILKEISRVLKPQGKLFISIENRYGFKYFLGKKENHCGGLRWITFLPRFIANAYSKLALKRPYRTWFHSYRAISRLLNNVSFKNLRFYSCYPNHVKYSHLYPIDAPFPCQYSLTHLVRTVKISFLEGITLQFLAFTRLILQTTQEFMIVATKEHKLTTRLVLSKPHTIVSLEFNQKRLQNIMKHSRNQREDWRIVREAQVLKAIRGLDNVPQLLEDGVLYNRPFIRQTAVTGFPIPKHRYSLDKVQAVMENVIRYEKFSRSNPIAMSRQQEIFDASLPASECVLNHSDLSPQNILWDSSNKNLHILDWELGTMNGIPGYDLFDFSFHLLSGDLFEFENALKKLRHSMDPQSSYMRSTINNHLGHKFEEYLRLFLQKKIAILERSSTQKSTLKITNLQTTLHSI